MKLADEKTEKDRGRRKLQSTTWWEIPHTFLADLINEENFAQNPFLTTNANDSIQQWSNNLSTDGRLCLLENTACVLGLLWLETGDDCLFPPSWKFSCNKATRSTASFCCPLTSKLQTQAFKAEGCFSIEVLGYLHPVVCTSSEMQL